MIHQPHMYRGNNAANMQARYTINSTNNTPYCTYYNSQGHMYNYCRLRQQNRQQQNSSYMPRFQQPRGMTMQRQTYAPRQYAQSRPVITQTVTLVSSKTAKLINISKITSVMGKIVLQGRRNHF